MEKIEEALELIEKLEEKYSITTGNLQKIREKFNDFKVYVPMIGKFSAGKSALVNMLLGFGVEICRENIGVETAVPTEVFFGEDEIIRLYGTEVREVYPQEYLKNQEGLLTENIDRITLQINCNMLRQFPNVAIVDMPGLDSGYEVHDRVIENYIRDSMAYVLVFPVTETTIEKSMEPILYDLNTYNMPICVVLTRGGRLIDIRQEEEKKYEVRKNLEKYFGQREIPVFITEKETGDLGGFEKFLIGMEYQAGESGRKFFKRRLEPEIFNIINYLSSCLENIKMPFPELEQEKKQLEEDIKNLNIVVEELADFEHEIPFIVNEITEAVETELLLRIEELIQEAVYELDVTEMLNNTIQYILNIKYQQLVMKKFGERLNRIETGILNRNAKFASGLKIDMDIICGKGLNGISKTANTLKIKPLGRKYSGAIADFLVRVFDENNQNKQNEVKEKTKPYLVQDVFPKIKQEVAERVEADLKQFLSVIHRNVDSAIEEQTRLLQRALEDVIEKKQYMDSECEKEINMIQNDKKRIERMQKWI